MIVSSFKKFVQMESNSGLLLFISAVIAIVISNSPYRAGYDHLLQMPVAIHFGHLNLSKPLLLWINDGLMAIFFFLVGLEIKREMLEGELSSLKKASLPLIAAFGGIVFPALIYLLFNYGDANALHGWAIPTATDIAFALGVLALLGSRVPESLKVFLTALAIFDDIGAILIIAVFYSHGISLSMLMFSGLSVLILWLLNYFNVTQKLPYFLIGSLLWFCVLKSGIHATIAGILLALFIPIRSKKDQEKSPLREIEHALHPWVAFLILPVFAFANAGLSFEGLSFHHFLSPVPIGIALGLFLGKQLGVFGSSWMSVRLGIAEQPGQTGNLGLYGISLIAGIGFTMSLFIGALAFGHTSSYSTLVRVGVIAGSLISGGFGCLILYHVGKKHQH